jgi:hypothetical protein
MDKNCSIGYPIQCKYQTIGGSSIGSNCTYCGFCDYQLPRDSRNIGLQENNKCKSCSSHSCDTNSTGDCPYNN